jgi:hypothetical protein
VVAAVVAVVEDMSVDARTVDGSVAVHQSVKTDGMVATRVIGVATSDVVVRQQLSLSHSFVPFSAPVLHKSR